MQAKQFKKMGFNLVRFHAPITYGKGANWAVIDNTTLYDLFFMVSQLLPTLSNHTTFVGTHAETIRDLHVSFRLLVWLLRLHWRRIPWQPGSALWSPVLQHGGANRLQESPGIVSSRIGVCCVDIPQRNHA